MTLVLLSAQCRLLKGRKEILAKAKSKKASLWHKTLGVTAILLIVGFGVAIGFLVHWQLVEGEKLKTQAMNQSLKTTSLTAMRGTIYDATETKVLAQSASVWTVVLEPNYIEDEATKKLISSGLSGILDLEYDYIYERTNYNNYFTYLKRKVETETKDAVLEFMKENDIDQGIRLIEDYKRYYPYGSTASVVLGFTGTDNNGLAGLELYYDQELSGTSGRMVSLKNAWGEDMPFQYEQLVTAENGYDLVLTIDEAVQSIVEKYLNEAAAQYSTKNGAAAILMDVNDGAIKAMAVSGGFDCNDPFTIYDETVRTEIDALPEEEQNDAYTAALNHQWRNKAVSDTYVPGSVFKMISGSIGLDSGAISTHTAFSCDGAYVAYKGTDPIKCWVHPGFHGVETIREGICNSCNPFMMQMAKVIGSKTFYNYFYAFGLTDKTGVDLPGESSSLFYTESELLPVELATESFGQGFTATPLQMITACAAIANGGYIVQPHVVEKILDSDGNIVESADTSYKRQVISDETSKTMISILQENATTGSGKNGYVEGYRVCGKTGTSEKVAEHNEHPEEAMEYIASFCGFAPADNPQYILLVFLDEPDRSIASGGLMAAPVFSKIMAEVLPYLGVEAQYTESEAEKNSTTAPNLIGKSIAEAETLIADADLYYSVYGDASDEDAVVLMQVPAAGADMPVGGKIVLYMEDKIADEDMCVVPDFVGKTLSECNDLANQAGVQILMTGAATDIMLQSQSQSIDAGTRVKPGTVIKVQFVDMSGLEQ